MGLALSRREGEELILTFDENMTESELKELLRSGIKVAVQEINVNRRQARIWIGAPRSVLIVRGELLTDPER